MRLPIGDSDDVDSPIVVVVRKSMVEVVRYVRWA